MSYSRWGNSVWYTYWCSTESKKRDDQLFDICGTHAFTYGELKTRGIDGCIEKLKDIITEKNNEENKMKQENMFVGHNYTTEEYEELKGYIREFMKDVEDEFNTPSQLYRDGVITLEDAFIEEV